MTALSACIGLFPAALSNGIGSQAQKPLATVVVGGFAERPDHAVACCACAANALPPRRPDRDATGGRRKRDASKKLLKPPKRPT
jgi:hypothetical protein